ncbi:flippase-like domain-containing protein [Opitutales bacterium ASA1]|uniref:lysylphosphatidylglycerol synthase transmembrane domain-containing protein n=1 Tax=Congregicoccus parvus TaxID=3081749 RepID=UPI002B30DF2D|nr:flippase-like domain-containing protein [Opitutales bacterium ASA1]
MSQAPRILDQKRMLRYVLQGLALGGIASVLVVIFTTREETFERLSQFSLATLPLLFGMVLVAWACNGFRVWLMCRAAGHPLAYRQAIAVSLSTEFGIAATPAGVGGTIIRLGLLRQAGVPLTTAGSLLATDAAVDIVFFGLLAPFAIYVLLHEGLLARLFDSPSEIDALILLAVVLACFVSLLLLLRSSTFHRRLSRLLGATAFGRRRRLPGRHRLLRRQTSRSIRSMGTSLGFLWRHRKGALFANLVIASLQWCCRYMMLPVILWSFGHPVNPLPLFLVQGVLFGLSLLVVAPGGGGSVELLTAIVLPTFVPTGLVGVVLIVWRFFTYHLYVLGGGAMFFYTCHHLHRLFPKFDGSATPELGLETEPESKGNARG